MLAVACLEAPPEFFQSIICHEKRSDRRRVNLCLATFDLDARMAEHTHAIIPFPAARRLAEVRQAALTIRDLDNEATLVWWKGFTRTMADRMLASGIGEAEVSAEIGLFQTAVFFELGKLYHDTAEGDVNEQY